MANNRSQINEQELVKGPLEGTSFFGKMIVETGTNAIVTLDGQYHETLPPGGKRGMNYPLFRECKIYIVATKDKRLTVETKGDLMVQKPTSVIIDLAIELSYRVFNPRIVVLEVAEPLHMLYDFALEAMKDTTSRLPYEEFLAGGHAALLILQHIQKYRLEQYLGLQVFNAQIVFISRGEQIRNIVTNKGTLTTDISTYPQVVANIEANQRAIDSYQQQLLHGLQHGQAEILVKLERLFAQNAQQFEQITRSFTRQWNLEMQKVNADCPSTFLLLPDSSSFFSVEAWFNRHYRLHLICQHPGTPHPVGEGYVIKEARDWWASVSPLISPMITFLKCAIPLGNVGGVAQGMLEQMQTGVDFLEQLEGMLPEVAQSGAPPIAHQQQLVGPALRAMSSVLNKVDPNHHWGGLHKTITPDGNILWLCDQHRP